MVFGDFLKGFGAYALVLVPGVILFFFDISRQRERIERNRRLLSYSILILYLVSLLHFLGFLYVKSYYIVMGIFGSLPLLSRFIVHPITHHVVIGTGFFFCIILLFASKRRRDRNRGFIVSAVVGLLLTFCFWLFAVLFNQGMEKRLLVGEYTVSKAFIPVTALVILGISYLFVLFYLLWYTKKRKPFWFATVLVFTGCLIAFYLFSWYLPLLAPTPGIQ